jgi:hypothetical protein
MNLFHIILIHSLQDTTKVIQLISCKQSAWELTKT